MNTRTKKILDPPKENFWLRLCIAFYMIFDSIPSKIKVNYFYWLNENKNSKLNLMHNFIFKIVHKSSTDILTECECNNVLHAQKDIYFHMDLLKFERYINQINNLWINPDFISLKSKINFLKIQR